MRKHIPLIAILLLAPYAAWQTYRAETALRIGHEIAGIAMVQQAALSAAGQIARIMDHGASQCAAQGQEPVALCFRLAGGQVVEAKGQCSQTPRPSGANRRAAD
jgi:hypothetical protein